MKRRLATALASAALLALSVTAGLNAAGAQTAQEGPARTGEKTIKPVEQSCPVHPEVKARTAGKCPKCRADERKMKSARDKDKSKVNRRQQQQEEGSAAND